MQLVLIHQIFRNILKSTLKSEVDKLDIRKLQSNPADLSKLSDVLKNEVAKIDNYDIKS